MGGLAVSRLSNKLHARRHHEITVEALSLLERESLTARLMEISAPLGVIGFPPLESGI